MITTEIHTSYFYKKISLYRHTNTKTMKVHFVANSSKQAFDVIVNLCSK